MAQKKAKTLRMGLRKAMLACGTAALYAAGSVASCLLATAAGLWIGSKIGG